MPPHLCLWYGPNLHSLTYIVCVLFNWFHSGSRKRCISHSSPKNLNRSSGPVSSVNVLLSRPLSISAVSLASGGDGGGTSKGGGGSGGGRRSGRGGGGNKDDKKSGQLLCPKCGDPTTHVETFVPCKYESMFREVSSNVRLLLSKSTGKSSLTGEVQCGDLCAILWINVQGSQCSSKLMSGCC